MILRGDIMRYLGSYLNSALHFKENNIIKCKAVLLTLFKVKATKKFLTRKASSKTVIALATPHLHCANNILVGIPRYNINLLQRVQNVAAKIVLGRNKYNSSLKCLEKLHWLPTQYRINFKVITLVLRCIHGLGLSYLEELIILKKPRRQGLGLENVTRQLEIPKNFKTHIYS